MMAISQADGPRVSRRALERNRDFQIATSHAKYLSHPSLASSVSKSSVSIPTSNP